MLKLAWTQRNCTVSRWKLDVDHCSDLKCIHLVVTDATCLPCIGLRCPVTKQEPDTKSDTLRAWKLLRSMHWSFVTATQSPLTLPNDPKSPHGPKERQQPFYHSHLHIHVQTFELQQLLQVPRGSVLRSKLQCSIQLYQDCLFQRLGQLSVVVIQPDCMSSSKMTYHTLGDGISWGMRLSLPETKLAKAQWLKFDYDYCVS